MNSAPIVLPIDPAIDSLEAVRLLVALLPVVGWTLAVAFLAILALGAGLSGLEPRSRNPARLVS
jgi:hypothetical protein